MTTEETIFKSIKLFVQDLSEVIRISEYKKIHLYNRLLTAHTPQEQYAKHITIFGDFVLRNKTSILEKKVDFVEPVIKYTEKVFINMNTVFSKIDKDSTECVWNHLIYILSLTHPDQVNPDRLKALIIPTSSNEDDILEDLFNTILTNIEGKEMNSPMELLGMLTTNPSIAKLIEQIQSGAIDMSKMLLSIKKIIKRLSSETDKPEMKEMLKQVEGMLNGTPDMGMMMSLMSGMMNKQN